MKPIYFNFVLDVLLFAYFYRNKPIISFDELNRSIVNKLQESLNPIFLIVASRTSNSGIFKDFIKDDCVKIIKQEKESFQIDEELTKMYEQGIAMPSNRHFIITEPFIRIDLFKDVDYHGTELDIRCRITPEIERQVYKIINQAIEYKNELLKMYKTAKYLYYKFEYALIGKVEKTQYFEDNEVMNGLKRLVPKIIYIKRSVNLNSFLTEVTGLLLDELYSLDIFKSYPIDLEMYPGLIPLIFPYRILETSVLSVNGTYFITFGFDVRAVMASDLSFLFSKNSVETIVSMGGLFLMTIVA